MKTAGKEDYLYSSYLAVLFDTTSDPIEQKKKCYNSCIENIMSKIHCMLLAAYKLW
jgi:hypothetical protein